MISKEEVEHIAKLARLELTENETEKMQKDLSAILDYFNLLKKAKSVKGKTKNQILKLKDSSNATRKDEAVSQPTSVANNLIAAAPDKKDNYIKVKQIL
jgi:aspartyl/glutamyl-tRNA(Asn/Gln) amidotransferase C subunit